MHVMLYSVHAHVSIPVEYLYIRAAAVYFKINQTLPVQIETFDKYTERTGLMGTRLSSQGLLELMKSYII